MEEIETKSCISCGKQLQGRADKKYCDDYCRNNYNNQRKAVINNHIRNINNALRKNRNILEEQLGDAETTRVHTDKLISLGYQFKYHTHTFSSQKGNHYTYCYEYGFMEMDNGWFLVVKAKEAATSS
jgi:predicted nucleic acid-binding Zn ribbon protein